MYLEVEGFKIIPYFVPDRDGILLQNGSRLEKHRAFEIDITSAWRKNYRKLEVLRAARKGMAIYINELREQFNLKYEDGVFRSPNLNVRSWIEQDTGKLYISFMDYTFKDLYDALIGLKELSLHYLPSLRTDEFFIDIIPKGYRITVPTPAVHYKDILFGRSILDYDRSLIEKHFPDIYSNE